VTSTSIFHCCIKSTFLPVSMSASLAASQGEYRHERSSAESEFDVVLLLMRGTSRGQKVIEGES